MEKRLFHHHVQLAVRNYEIDWQGIVHNAVYLHYFEVGRIAYLDQIGSKLDINTVNHESKVVLARNEIDYRKPARFGDILTVYSRISLIKNSSFVFEGFIEKESTSDIIAENVAVHVWLDPRTNSPTTVPDAFRNRVRQLEGKDCVIQQPTMIV
ncbi:MAG TPA: thioesterase family protein [Bacteroidota bacterium]|nr:thioesterase family protein [Bacteroidota bacterium]